MTGEEIVRVLASALAEAALPHALIGGHAVNAYLEPRFTADIDVTVQADVEALERVRTALALRGYEVSTEDGADLPSGPDFVRFTAGPGDPPIELQVAKTSLQVELVQRARRSSPTSPAIATAEDLIILKLIANRAKDQIDVCGLVKLPDLDWAYLEHWAQQWEVVELLDRLRGRDSRAR